MLIKYATGGNSHQKTLLTILVKRVINFLAKKKTPYKLTINFDCLKMLFQSRNRAKLDFQEIVQEAKRGLGILML